MIITATPTIAVFAAAFFWLRYSGHETNSFTAAVIKSVSIASLAVFGLLIGAPGWIVLGLGLGAAGDYALARPGDRAFMAGMVAFALGHLAYVFEFASRIPTEPLQNPTNFWLVFALMVALVALTSIWIAPKAGAFTWPVRGYAVVIAAMALSATLLPHSLSRLTIQLGVGAFVASDVILALRMFVFSGARTRLWAGRMLWPLYWAGQFMILMGTYA